MAVAHESDTHIGKGELDTFCLNIRPGQHVKITAGVLQGSEAVVVSQRTGGRVLVHLQKGLYVEVHQFCLEAAKPIKKIKNQAGRND